MLVACTRTRTSRSPTAGSGTSAARTVSLPYFSTTNAFMSASFPRDPFDGFPVAVGTPGLRAPDPTI